MRMVRRSLCAALRRSACLVGLAIAFPLAAAAQRPRYAVSASDTLRLREVSNGTMVIEMPGGPLTVTTEHDAVLGVTRAAGDTVLAWYESLHIAATSPQGRMQPATTDALGKPFVLRWPAEGRAVLVRAPAFPASFAGVSDLSHQFDDFFLPLPAAPLAIGTTWSDTAARTDSGGASDTWMRATRIGSYRVLRDTLVASRPALVISADQRQRVRSGGPLPNGAGRVETALVGGDSGVFVFDAAAGRLLGRRREGEMRGTFTVHPASGPSAPMGQTMRYTNTIDAVPVGTRVRPTVPGDRRGE